MKKIRVLIVDDSSVYRAQIRQALSELTEAEVAGSAPNGRAALDILEQMTVDLILLDLEMPIMDGISTLREIQRKKLPVKIVLFASSSKRGAEATFEALRLGASDFIAKPSGADVTQLAGGDSPSAKIRSVLEPCLEALFPIEMRTSPASAQEAVEEVSNVRVLWETFQPAVIVVGSSTGGPGALERMFTRLKAPISCPILLAQHMPPIFTATLAENLQKWSGIPAREATHGETALPNHIYVAPGGYHLRLGGTRSKPILLLDQGPPENFVRPAVDPLFRSAADLVGEKCLAVVLTGMGSDGRLGAIRVKERRGAVLTQNEESCVVYGMPGAVKSNGVSDGEGTPEEIGEKISEKVQEKVAITWRTKQL